MNDDLLSSLASAWGEDRPTEPNPAHLPDLLLLSDQRLQEGVECFRGLLSHFESLLQRMMIAQNNLSALLLRKDEIPKELYRAALENQEAFRDAVEGLEGVLALQPDDPVESYWDALGDLEEVSEALRGSTEELVRLSKA